MQNVKPLVLSTLKSVSGFNNNVFGSFPDRFKDLPCASYYEAFNSPESSADDDEYVSEIIFVIDVWAKANEETSDLAIETDSAMKKAGFIREFAADVNDPISAVRHKTMRFRLLI